MRHRPAFSVGRCSESRRQSGKGFFPAAPTEILPFTPLTAGTASPSGGEGGNGLAAYRAGWFPM